MKPFEDLVQKVKDNMIDGDIMCLVFPFQDIQDRLYGVPLSRISELYRLLASNNILVRRAPDKYLFVKLLELRTR